MILNLFQALVLVLIDDIQDVLAELHIIFGLLKQETIDLLCVVFELILLLRYVKSRLCSVYDDIKYDIVNKLDLFVLALSQLAVKAFGNVDT